jgi:large conductance mechanosensitive channel
MAMWWEKIKEEEGDIAKKAGGLWNDFKQFALKGNVVDLAVAVVVGGAFSGVVNALVADIIQPFIALIGPSNSFGSETIVLRATSTPAVPGGPASAPVILNYGGFLQSIESFIIVAGSIFFMIKLVSVGRNRLFRHEQKKEAQGTPPPPAPSAEVQVLQEIRDLLKNSGDPVEKPAGAGSQAASGEEKKSGNS